jgi:transmembrane sensor
MTMFTRWANRQAAEHFLALHDADATPDSISAALHWLEQDEENSLAFDRLQRFWNRCDNVEMVLPSADLPQAGTSAFWRQPAFRMIAACLLIVIGIASLVFYYSDDLFRREPRSVSYASAIGETRVLNMPDRSQIILGGASAVTVLYDANVRHIVLSDGEALFNVAGDPQRPFLVDSGAGSIRAVGTSFNVHRSYTGTTVTVVHGTVEIKSRNEDSQGPDLLQRGMQISYTARGELGDIRRVNVDQVTSWQSGTLRYTRQPLAAVLADLNRYTPRPILFDDPQVGLLEITGAVRTGSITDWLSGLASATGLEIIDSDPGVIRLRMRPEISNPGKKLFPRVTTTAS